MKQIMLPSVLAALLATSGCATFCGKQLPKQSAKPQLIKKEYLITESVFFDSVSLLQSGGSVPLHGYLAPHLKKTIVDAGGMLSAEKKIDGEIKLQTAIALARYKALPDIEKIRVAYGRQVYLEVMNMENSSVTLPAEGIVEAAYEKQFRKEFYEKLRADIEFRRQKLPSDAIWIDCGTSLVEGNATWFLEGLLCGCSLTLIPAHHNKVLDVKISVYEDGKIYTREYKDSWNIIFWLPLLPIGLVQGSNDKIVDSIKNNLAITAVNDFQKELGKNKQ